MPRPATARALWLARNVLPHEPELRGWLSRKRLQTIDIDDVVQEMYAIFAGLDSVNEIRNPRTYLFSVANSVVLAQFRRARIIPITAAGDLEAAAGDSGEPTPETVCVDRDELHRLAEAIAGLPDRCRQVFILRKIEGLSQREVAKRLGVSEGTIEKHVHRGLYILMGVIGRGGRGVPQASKRRSASDRDDTGADGPAGNSRRN